MKLTDQIDHQAGLSRERFEHDYLDPLRPVIITDAITHWPALGKWTPQFFKQNYGELEVEVDGEAMALRDLIDRVEASTDESPAPYLRNQALAQWPPELMMDVSPMPECTRPNWLESRFFATVTKLAAIEVYIGGRGARFPTLHYDGLHTHAFLMQLYGDKEYIVFSPDQSPYVYPRSAGGNVSQIENLLDSDLDAFPLFERAEGVRFELHSGETLFVPSGWWHTARILSPSVTVSINAVNRANYANFRRDYCASIAQRSRLKGFVAWAGLAVGHATHLFEDYENLSPLLTDPRVFGSARQGGAVAAEGEHDQSDECLQGAESERNPVRSRMLVLLDSINPWARARRLGIRKAHGERETMKHG